MMRKVTIAAAAACVFAVMSQAAFAEEILLGLRNPATVDAVKAKLTSEGYTQIKQIRNCMAAATRPRVSTAPASASRSK